MDVRERERGPETAAEIFFSEREISFLICERESWRELSAVKGELGERRGREKQGVVSARESWP